MNIEHIRIENEGYVYCNSRFYSCQDVLSAENTYDFYPGVNMLTGEIDSGIWAISYLISMYDHLPKKEATLFRTPDIIVNGEKITLKQFSKYSCYMDESFPMFATKQSIKNLVESALKKSKLGYRSDDIRDIFQISADRFERPLSGVGNELFKCMAAIGFAHNKEVFCFPWLSKKRFDNYHGNITGLLEILQSLGKIVIVPIGNTVDTASKAGMDGH